MRDIAVLIFLIGCIAAAIRKPWLGVLALTCFSYLNPHAYTWGFMYDFPAYQVLFIGVAFAFLTHPHPTRFPKDWRIPTFFLLWGYFLLTTSFSMVPDVAWQKLQEVSKIYLPLLFTLLLIDNRKKLFFLIITITASFGILAVKGGIFALSSGFAHRVYGPPGTQFAENNAFAVAVLMNIPLIVLWLRETTDKRLRYLLMAAIPLSIVSALSSWSRGGLLTLAAVSLTLIWHSKRKILALPVFLLGFYLALNHLPEEWFSRMYTIETYQTDASAMGRLRVWKDGLDYAFEHPWTGAGFEGWRYVTIKDWHNSFIEIMAEHGLIAFGLWFSLMFGTIISLTRLARLGRQAPGLTWITNYSTMIRASIIAYAAGTMFLGLAYWDIFYHLVFISVLLKKFAYEEYNAWQEQTSRSTIKIPSNSTARSPRLLTNIPSNTL